MRGGDAVFGAAGSHADQLERAEVGGNEREPGDPRRDRTPGQEEVRGRFEVAPQREADADDEAGVSE